MKKLIYSSFVASFIAFTTPSQADYYAGVGFGASFNDGAVETNNIKSSYKDSPIYTIYGGYELPLPILDIRGEAEILYMKPKVKDGRDRKLQSVMLNGVAVIPFVPLIDPYVGLGFGYARYDHTNAMAVQGMLGIEYELPIAPMTVGAEYRYYKINEGTGKTNSESKFHTNILMLKAKYLF